MPPESEEVESNRDDTTGKKQLVLSDLLPMHRHLSVKARKKRKKRTGKKMKRKTGKKSGWGKEIKKEGGQLGLLLDAQLKAS